MFEGLREDQLKGAIEALLFVSDEPVSVITLSDMLEVDPTQVAEALVQLQEDLAAGPGGICLKEVASGWRLFTAAEYHELLERYVLSWDTRKLSQAALETLAIVAYGQPITRNGVSSIRGVNSDSSLNSLIDKGLVREAGASDAPGNPMLYATTRTFLEKFGLSSTKELPPLEEFAPDDETASFLRQSLTAHAFDQDDFPDVFEGEGDAYASGVFDPEGEAAGQLVSAQGSDGPAEPREASGKGAAASRDGAAASHDSASSEQGGNGSAMNDLFSAMMGEALAKSAGLVEKIDFDSLEFEE